MKDTPQPAGAHPVLVNRLGVVLDPLGHLDSPALRYLILNLNTIQSAFEFEILDGPDEDPLLGQLASDVVLERKSIKAMVPDFIARLKAHIEKRNEIFKCQELLPDKFVILSMARFKDEYYSTRAPDGAPYCGIIALGNWERIMSPPTLAEFFLILLLRQAAALASPSLSGTMHYGTKGCLFDFNNNLSHVRNQVLTGFVCDFCTKKLEHDGHGYMKKELLKVLAWDWLGSADETKSPASIASNLGDNLFVIKGLKTNSLEKLQAVMAKESVKQAIQIIGAVVLAYLLLHFGLQSPK